MKVAVLMTVYTCPELTNIFVGQILKNKDAQVFIHVDKKYEEIKTQITVNERVHIIHNNIKVEWGNFTHIQSILNMMEYARKADDFEYYSINSGQDLLIKPMDEIVDFLEKDNKLAYLDCEKMPIAEWGKEGGMDRVTYRWPKFLVRRIGKRSPLKLIRRSFIILSKSHLIKRNKLPKEITWYGGSDWFTVRKDGVEEILRVCKQDKVFDDIFKHTFIGSEIYFNTILCNMKNAKEINKKDNLRYIDWTNREEGQAKGSPKTMRKSDLEGMKKSGKLFARKFTISERELIDNVVKITN